jgi:hypothetical protein
VIDIKRLNYLAFALIFLVVGGMLGYYFGKISTKENVTNSNDAEMNELEGKVEELTDKLLDLQKSYPAVGPNSTMAGKIFQISENEILMYLLNSTTSTGPIKAAIITQETIFSYFTSRPEEEINQLLQANSSLSSQSNSVRYKEVFISINDLKINNTITVQSYVNVHTEDEFTVHKVVLQKVPAPYPNGHK